MLSFKQHLLQEDENLKKSIIDDLRKRAPNDEVFNKLHSILQKYSGASNWVDNVIRSFNERKDQDINNTIRNFLVDLFDTIGFKESNYEGIAQFLEGFRTGKEFIDIDNLVPISGMTEFNSISSLWTNDQDNSENVIKFLNTLYIKSLNLKLTKSDAGPGEVFLAIISKDITFPPKVAATPEELGGDIVVIGRKIEVKGEGGRIYDNKAFPVALSAAAKRRFVEYFYSILNASSERSKFKDIQKFKPGLKYTVGVMFKFLDRIFSVESAGSSTEAELIDLIKRNKKMDIARVSPFKLTNIAIKYIGAERPINSEAISVNFINESALNIPRTSSNYSSMIDEFCSSFFSDDIAKYSAMIKKTFGTPKFKETWLSIIFQHYRKVKHFEGILYIRPQTYKYIMVSAQLDGAIGTPGNVMSVSGQPREMFPGLK